MQSLKTEEHKVLLEDVLVNPQGKYVFVLVGLPARGKSYISRLIARYFNWLGIKTKIFNVGEYRRKILGSGQPSDFWDPSNKENFAKREKLSRIAMKDLLNYLESGGQVAMFDATNSTRARRDYILKTLLNANIHRHRIIFIESICNDPNIIQESIQNIKVKSEDYKNVNAEEAVKDFIDRMHKYEAIYQTLTLDYDGNSSWIKIINVGEQFHLNHIYGYIPSKVVSLLMNTHIVPRAIYLTRHGESMDNVKEKIGGDSELSPKGQCYSAVLSRFIAEKSKQDPYFQLSIWTSSLKRTIQTAESIKDYPKVSWKALDEIDAGICDGMTYKEIEREYPNEWQARQMDKFNYRYPRGESYKDMIQRLEPVIIELERQKTPVMIVSHQAVTRVLYAYFTGRKPEECVNLPVPLHTVIELMPHSYGQSEVRHDLDALVREEYEKRKIK